MKYIVMEIQTNATGTVGNLVNAYDTQNAAESQYHTVLAAAAISQLPEHAAVLMTSRGQLLETKWYRHEQEPEPEPEPEEE